jgi:peptidoglycan/LPS O-acetylase OafA/YrhL
MGSNHKKHFAGLDELRGIACLMVMLNHFATYKDMYGVGDPFTHLVFRDWGTSGLDLFFILSGFLITYLLLFEQSVEGSISAPKFYMRRILRLWPVYFIIILLGHVIGVWATDFFDPRNDNPIIQQQYWGRTLFIALLLPHITYLKYHPVSVITAHTWSIGVEEQFYWGWPWVVKLVRKRLVPLMVMLIVLSFISEFIYFYLYDHKWLIASYRWISITSSINAFFYWSRAGYFALGGLLAYCFLNREGVRKYICHPVSLVAACMGAFIFTYWLKVIVCSGMLLACSYAIIVGNVIWRGNPFRGLTMRALGYVGKISYGVYMYHPMLLIGILAVNHKWGFPVSGFIPNLSIFIICIAAAVTIATISYKYIEQPFLRHRSKYR